MFGVALRFVGGIIQGRLVGPEILGYYSRFTILPGYLMFLELGVFVALARHYPYYIGKGDRDRALSYAANALGWSRLLCMVHVLVFLVPCLWAASHRNWPAAIGWGSQIVLTVSSMYMLYLASTYRNSSEFVYWSKASTISSIFSVLFLPLLTVYQFIGVCVRNSLPNLISMVYAHAKRPLKIHPRFDRKVLKNMIAFGAPLMFFGYLLTSCWDATLRIYILRLIDERTLGIFALAAGICAGLTTVATSISQVFHPRIAMLYGSSGENKTATFRYCAKCSIAGLAVLLPLVAVVVWLIDPFVRLFLPKYVECIPIVRCLSWLALVPVLDLPYIMIVAAQGTRQYGISVVVGFALFVIVLGLLALTHRVTLLKIVTASVACKLAATFLVDWFAWRMARSEEVPAP